MKETLDKVDRLAALLWDATRLAREINEDWKKERDNESARIVSAYKIEQFAKEVRREAVVDALLAIVADRFPTLEWDKAEWEKAAKETNEPLAEMVERFIAEVESDAGIKRVWKTALDKARRLLPMDRTVPYEQRRSIAELDGATLKCRAGLWSYDKLASYRWAEELAALEIVAAVAAGEPVLEAARRTGFVADAINSGEPGKKLQLAVGRVAWVRAFKNARLDVCFSSEALAQKVAALLTGSEGGA